MASTVMRPSNFRHDKRGSQVVEIRREEYERSKQDILAKIRRRLVILGVVIGVMALISLSLGGFVRGSFTKIAKFRKTLLGVRVQDLYFAYGVEAAVFCLHGFYMDGSWRHLQTDGYRLVMHVRVYSALGAISCLLALWLAAAILSSFGLVEVRYIGESSQNVIYLMTLLIASVHLVVSPWLLRTIHRKGSQADEYFGAEFLSDIRKARRRDRYRAHSAVHEQEESAEEDDDHEVDDTPPPMPTSSRSPRSSRHGSPRSQRQRLYPDEMARSPPGPSRTAFYGADGNHDVIHSSHTAVSVALAETEDYGQSFAAAPHKINSSGRQTPRIPFASPVFVLDPEPRLQPPEFWQLWKQTETTGAFSCSFTNRPTRVEVETHLQAQGYHVVATEQRDQVLQVYFCAHQLGTDTFFLCEFVLLFARRFFQATFKCQDEAVASDFVTRFHLQHILTLEGQQQQ